MAAKINVYLTNGNVNVYEVPNEAKAREHADSIIRTGYRSVSEEEPNVLTYWPPHAILKVKIELPEASRTRYFDLTVST